MNGLTILPHDVVNLAPEYEAMPKYLTVGQAADLLQVDRTTVWRWMKDGRFAGVRRKGFGLTSPNLIPQESVEEVARQLEIIDEGENTVSPE